MPPAFPHVTDTEFTILDVLWDQGPATIGQITAEIYEENTATEYATVKSLLGRLESKGYVTRDRSAFAHVFAAKIERASFIGQQLQEMADRVSGGSLKPLLINLVERTRLTKRDREMLRKMIDDAE